MSSKIILTGATGTAGSETLLQLLLHPSISRISVLARSPLPPTLLAALPAEAVQAKLSVIVMDDFEVYPEEVMSQLQGHEACIWTLGISYGLVEKEEYRRLTLGYAVAAAKAFQPLSENFRFVFISGQGTSAWNPNAGMRIKASTEQALFGIFGSKGTFCFRPGGIVPFTSELKDVVTPRNPMEVRLRPWAGTLERWMPSSVIDTKDLALAMIETALKGENPQGEGQAKKVRILENMEIRELGRKVREAMTAAAGATTAK